MATISKISMIGIWIETLLYGVNCVMYGLCMHTLLHGAKPATRRWVLLMTSTVIFCLCTVHVGASLQQLLDAFIYAPADVPDYSAMYWLDGSTMLRLLKDTVYSTLVLAQDAILIWRLYVVFLYDWRVIIFPIVLMVGAIGCLYVSVASVRSEASTLILSAWVMGLVFNVSVSGGITARLWWVGRTIASLTTTATNQYASSIYLIIESGAISVACGTAVFALFISNSPFAFSSFDVAAQLLVLSQFLIVVQAQKTSPYRITKGDPSRLMPTAQDEIVFRAASREQE